MSRNDQEFCFDYFNCKELDCPRRNNLSRNCWEIDHVQCHSHGDGFKALIRHLGSRTEVCKLCIYYQNHH